MNIQERIKEAGVVGAGGAGFPTHVKAGAYADCLIANDAECELLMHKDFELMARHAAEVAREQGCHPIAKSRIAVGKGLRIDLCSSNPKG